MKATKVGNIDESASATRWAMRMEAVALEEPDRLLGCLTGVITRCGGWILSRGLSDGGKVTLLFEFERSACVDIYSGLAGAGVELTRSCHLRFTELCQCTRSSLENSGGEIASIDLEIQTYPVKLAAQTQVPSGSQEDR